MKFQALVCASLFLLKVTMNAITGLLALSHKSPTLTFVHNCTLKVMCLYILFNKDIEFTKGVVEKPATVNNTRKQKEQHCVHW